MRTQMGGPPGGGGRRCKNHTRQPPQASRACGGRPDADSGPRSEGQGRGRGRISRRVLQEMISRLGRVDLGSGPGSGRRRGASGGGNGGCGSQEQDEGAGRPNADAPGPRRRAGRAESREGTRARGAARGAAGGRPGARGGRGAGEARGRRRRPAPRAHLPQSRNSATYLSRRRAEWLHSVYRQTSTSSSVSTLRALSLRHGPSRSSCSSFLSRTLADMVPRGPLPTRRTLAARSASPSGRALGGPAAASPGSCGASSPPRPRRRAPA